MTYIPMQKGFVYGPVGSKRLGKSLGVNITPAGRKVCTFNCVYCHYGPTGVGEYEFPPVDEVAGALEARLRTHLEIDYITFAGNGEPTMHPAFLEIVRVVHSLRDRFSAGTPIALLSNSTQLGRLDVTEALKLIDFPILKLDAGDAQTLQSVNRPVHVLDVDEIIERLAALPEVNLQTVMIGGRTTTSEGPVLESWLAALGRIQPRLIQLYSPDAPIEPEGVVPVAVERLKEIACHIQEKLGFDAHAY